MTTGRINQVTIVRRGDGQLLETQGEEISSYWGGPLVSGPRGAAAEPGMSQVRDRPHLLSPFEFPKALSAGGSGSPKLPSTPPKSLKRRPCREGQRPKAPPKQLVPPVAMLQG